MGLLLRGSEKRLNEACLARPPRYVAGDELLEVTPAAIRIRKEVLDPQQRKVLARQAERRQ